jgi:hypothetical protein
MIDQTTSHPIHLFPSATISVTSISWHPNEFVLAATLTSGALILTRVGERSDGEKTDRDYRGISRDLVPNGFHRHEYDGYEDVEEGIEEPVSYEMSFDNSFASRREEEMALDEENLYE